MNGCARRVTPDGIIQTVVDGGDASLADGQLAQKITFGGTGPKGVTIAGDGTLFVTTSAAIYRVAAGLPQVA